MIHCPRVEGAASGVEFTNQTSSGCAGAGEGLLVDSDQIRSEYPRPPHFCRGRNHSADQFLYTFLAFLREKVRFFWGGHQKSRSAPMAEQKPPASAVRSLASEHEKRRAFAVRSAAPPRPDSVAPPPPAAWTSRLFWGPPKKSRSAACRLRLSPSALRCRAKKTASARWHPKNLRRKNFHQHRLPNGRNMYVRSFIRAVEK